MGNDDDLFPNASGGGGHYNNYSSSDVPYINGSPSNSGTLNLDSSGGLGMDSTLGIYLIALLSNSNDVISNSMWS